MDEQALPGERPEALAARLARTKALAVAQRLGDLGSPESHLDISQSSPGEHSLFCDEPSVVGAGDQHPMPAAPLDSLADVSALNAMVLAADTVVVLGGEILGKPRDGAVATAMLGALRGRAHRVLTGVALAAGGKIVWSSVVKTTVRMRAYSADEVERYVQSGRPLDKAGAYGIQDADFRPVAGIEGCFTNVVGLPLCEVRRALAALGHDFEDETRSCAELCERARAWFGGAVVG